MFGIDSSEFLVICLVALVVIGPKDLPRVMRTVGQWVGRARGMASHFRAGVDNMIRESELADMEKKWKAENERIMREHSPQAIVDKWAEPAAGAEPAPAPAVLPEPAPEPAPAPAPKSTVARPKAPPPRGGPPRRAAPPIPPRKPAAPDGAP